MSSLIDLFMECWMVDDVLLSNNNFVILVVYLILRLETPRMSYMSTPPFDTGFIDMKVSNLA